MHEPSNTITLLEIERLTTPGPALATTPEKSNAKADPTARALPILQGTSAATAAILEMSWCSDAASHPQNRTPAKCKRLTTEPGVLKRIGCAPETHVAGDHADDAVSERLGSASGDEPNPTRPAGGQPKSGTRARSIPHQSF